MNGMQAFGSYSPKSKLTCNLHSHIFLDKLTKIIVYNKTYLKAHQNWHCSRRKGAAVTGSMCDTGWLEGLISVKPEVVVGCVDHKIAKK